MDPYPHWGSNHPLGDWGRVCYQLHQVFYVSLESNRASAETPQIVKWPRKNPFHYKRSKGFGSCPCRGLPLALAGGGLGPCRFVLAA